MSQRTIYWFRNDLRLYDNEAFHTAVDASREIIPVYVFDPRQFQVTRLGFRRTGALRAKFLIDSVSDLRAKLRAKGGDLLVRVGEPEKIIAQLAEEYQAGDVFASKEIAPQETRIESSLSKKLKITNVDIDLYWMDTLIPAEKLPFSIARLPNCLTEFYGMASDKVITVKTFPEPDNIITPADLDAGLIPTLAQLGIDPDELNSVTQQVQGGESSAGKILDDVKIKLYNEPRYNESSELLIETHLSDWLAVGCISPATIYRTLELHSQDTPGKKKLVGNLLARDYFNWTLLKYGPRLFKPSGVTHNMALRWTNDHSIFEQWINGQTADADMNALMHRLNETGHLTLQERQRLARFLADTLNVNWTWGAMYFESRLLDYKVAVNWGRWNNVAGVGKS